MLLYGPQAVRAAPQGGLADSAFAPSNSVSRGSMQCSMNTSLYGLTSVLTALSFPKEAQHQQEIDSGWCRTGISSVAAFLPIYSDF